MGLISFAKSAGRKLLRRDDGGGQAEQQALSDASAAEAPPALPAVAAGADQEPAAPTYTVDTSASADLIAQSIAVAQQAAAQSGTPAPAVDTSTHGTAIGAGATRVYITKDGNSVEEIAAFFYGDAAHAVRIREENPVLAGFSGALPGGLRLTVSEDVAAAADTGLVGRDAAGDAEAAARLVEIVDELGIPVQDFIIHVSGDTATITGAAASQADREKVVLVVGNTAGIATVDDQLTVQEAAPAPESVFYTVQPGDTLSAIAAAYYGDPNTYQTLFEANQPMLEHPDRIYPGQTLRIPPASQ